MRRSPDLFDAFAARDIELMRRLLSAGADPDVLDDDLVAPLAVAARRADRDVVRALLDAGAGTMTGIEPPWEQAFIGGDLEIQRWFLEAGADPNVRFEDDFTPLMLAAQTGLEAVEQLLAAGADPKATNRDGNSALSLAAERGDLAVYDRLAPLSGPEEASRVPRPGS